MQTYRISAADLDTLCEKTAAAQTLLNVNCVALLAGRKPVPATVRLDLAEEAEDIVHDLADILARLKAQKDGPPMH